MSDLTSKPYHGQTVFVVQNPETTATRTLLYAKYNEQTDKFMPPDKFDNPVAKDGWTCLGWSDIVYWFPLPDDYERLMAAVLLTHEALKEIAEGKGRYSEDRLTHAQNTIEDMIKIAKDAISDIETLHT